MPSLDLQGVRLHYEDSGPAPGAGQGSQTLLFAHGLLWDGRLWEPQIEAFRDRYRCITFDFRGQGRTEVTDDGYDMDTLAEDAAALIEALDIGPCHFVGLSMGGFVGMRVAARRPELVRSLCLLETSSEPEPRKNVPRYRLLNFIARWFGLGLVAGRVMKILFGRTFLHDPTRADERRELRRRLVGNHRIGISRAVDGVIERQGIEGELGKIQAPTLILVGDEDVATIPAKSQRIHEGIAGSQLVIIPQAGHTSNLEQPEAVNAALEEFLTGVSAS
ncbi:MAG: alpha/beta fold hydrolase [Acidobacteriota bacterium]|nr:alpha/beta fold hydrolase [Acidobacteriota bacterium]